jgi:hypothetical protein
MEVEFLACNRARVSYTLDAPPLAGQFEIQPLEQSAVGPFDCEAVIGNGFPDPVVGPTAR